MAVIVAAKRAAAEREHNDRAWLAWTTAALRRAKRMPPLADLLVKSKREAKRGAMTADAMLTMARMWSAVAGAKKG